ncbi:MAG: hypothetical protein R6T98_08310 [Desulfatiglandales bacterium]
MDISDDFFAVSGITIFFLLCSFLFIVFSVIIPSLMCEAIDFLLCDLREGALVKVFFEIPESSLFGFSRPSHRTQGSPLLVFIRDIGSHSDGLGIEDVVITSVNYCQTSIFTTVIYSEPEHVTYLQGQQTPPLFMRNGVYA